jgi:UDP-MurNAc hydroxylase
MRFRVLGHAALEAAHEDVSVLIDPWLVGSCYWRSWWNFPEPDPELVSSLKPNFIYLTHLHWDHFHGPTLRRFDRSTPVIVPKFLTRRMVKDLNWLGFDDVREIPHGGSIALGQDFYLHSFQFGPGADSAVALTGGGRTLLNVNDCKFFGLPLRALLRRFPQPDFVFRSHSSASAIPYCIEGFEERFPALRTQADYEEEFARFALYCEAKYAIPFASNHCFLHRDTRKFNAMAVSPGAAAAHCNALSERVGAETRAVVMAPGSSWDDETGFALVDFDFAAKEPYIDALSARHAPALARQYDAEAAEIADWSAFARYFEDLLSRTPRVVARRFGVIAFHVEDAAGSRYWLVDGPNNLVAEAAIAPSGAVIVSTPALVLNQCCHRRMFSVWTASKRLTIHLDAESALRRLEVFLLVLDAFELDQLPLWNNLSLRGIDLVMRRWREGIELCRVVVQRHLGRRFKYAENYPLRADRSRMKATFTVR